MKVHRVGSLRSNATFIVAFAAVTGFVGVNLSSPFLVVTSSVGLAHPYDQTDPQEFTSPADYAVSVSNETYVAEKKAKESVLQAVGGGPAAAKAYAAEAVSARGWSSTEYNCLVALWHKESGWRVNALNTSSGAYGIPQSLPGHKMAAAGADWETNPVTQIEWGLGYISGRYGTPCDAWGHSQRLDWY